MIWVENTNDRECIFDGSANTSRKSQKGFLTVSQNIATKEPVGVYLLMALENNCDNALLSGKSEADSRFKQLVGSILPSP